MKTFGAHLVLLIGGLAFAVYLDGPSMPDASRNASLRRTDSASWRRTTHGWELMTDWEHKAPRAEPWSHINAIHPVAFGGLQLLASIGALVALSPDGVCAAHRTTQLTSV